MNYSVLIVCTLLPLSIIAQTSKPTILASVCAPNKLIQIKVIPPNPLLEIYRKSENELHFSLIGKIVDSILQDRSTMALSGKWCFYRFKMPNGKLSQQEARGRVCPPSSMIAVVPYTPLDRTAQNIDFQWSALYKVEKYQLQVARNESDFSYETGFGSENILLDTTISTNVLNWKSGLKIKDTLYWAVKPILEGDKTYFMNPISTIVNPNPIFSNTGILVNISKLEIKPNKITLKLKNTTIEPLKEVKLHYFVSDTNIFTLKARLLTTQLFETVAPNRQGMKVQQDLPLKGLTGYLLIVPSVNGRILEKEWVVKPLPK